MFGALIQCRIQDELRTECSLYYNKTVRIRRRRYGKNDWPDIDVMALPADC